MSLGSSIHWAFVIYALWTTASNVQSSPQTIAPSVLIVSLKLMAPASAPICPTNQVCKGYAKNVQFLAAPHASLETAAPAPNA